MKFRDIIKLILGLSGGSSSNPDGVIKHSEASTGAASSKFTQTPGVAAVGAAGLASSSYASLIMSALGLAYGVYQDQRGWNNMSPADKQSLDYQDEIADQNAIDSYMRQKEFQDAYLTPAAQIRSQAEGFQAVGLNKMLLGGSAPGASSSTGSQAQLGATSGNGTQNIGALIGSLIGAVQQSRKIDIEASHTSAQNELLRQQAESQRIENKYKDEYWNTQLTSMKENIAQVRANTRKLISDAGYSEMLALYAPALLEANVRTSESQVKLNESMAALNDSRKKEIEELVKNHRKERELMDANIGKIASEIELITSQKNLNEQEIEESKARISKLNKEVEQIGAEIGLTALDTKYYIWNHPRTNTLPFGFKWNRSSENGRNGFNITGLTDEEILTAARARGLISEP